METIRPESYKEEDARAEYSAVVGFHTTLVNGRFTVTGLYVAAVGFLAAAVLGKEISAVARVAGSGLGCWLTGCLWILELRNRSLANNICKRGIDIEHKYWGLTNSDDWYSGFFSRQYREPPESELEGCGLSRRKAPDRPTLGWANKPISEKLSRFVSHSMGVDLLFGGCGVFWLICFLWSVMGVFRS